MSGNGFWAGAGSSDFATAPFRVSTSGGVTAKNISVVGGTVSVGDAPVAISYLARSASGIVTIKTATAVNATVGQNITIDVTSAPWATDADFNGAFNVLSITASSPYTITYQGATSSAVAEVAATGFVYTGARISGESASGTWFSVDTGFVLKNPANVSQNIITATASDVTINADFIKAGTVTLGNLGANAIQSTNFSVSNTGTITAQDGTVGGWTLASTKLSSGTSTSYVALATSGGYSIYAGDETPSSAPFSVTPQGALTAKSGAIGGFTLASDRLTNLGASKYAGIIDTALDTGLAFFAGATNTSGSSATFAVTNAGAVTASDITATGGTVGGWTLASSRLYSSATSGATTKFYGVVADPVFLGRAFFAGATNSAGDGAVFEVLNDGSVVANNLSITGGPAAGNVISVNSGTFSVTSAGAMTATSASVTGTISTSNITATGGFIGGWTLNSTSLTNSGGASGQYAGILDTPSTGLAFFAGATNNVGASAKFSVTNDGAITATSGTIGGYTLASDRLTNASTTGSVKYAGLIDTADETGLAFFAGATGTDGASAKFTVTNAGAMTATSGLIGGYTIASDRLTNASSTGSVKYAGLIDTALDTGLAFFAGATGTDGAGATFAVTNAGALSASSVSITGGSITIGVGSSFSVTSDGQVAAKGGYFDPVDTGTLFRPAVVVAGNTTQGDIAAAGNGTTATGTLNLGVTTLGATGTAATGQFTNVLQMTKDLITANKTLYIGSASTSTTGLSFKQNRGHIAPFSASDSNNSIGFYTSSSRATFTPVVASAFFPGGNGSSNLGYDGTNLTMNDSLVVTGRVYGTLGIGSTSYFTKTWVDTSLTPSFGTAPTATNMSAGDLAIFNQSGTRRIYADDFSDGVYYVNLTSASDIRLKQNISDYSGGLAKILSMRPVTFNWKEVPEGKTQIGLIAQDLQEIEPSLVDTQDILAPDPRIDEITDGKLLMPDIDGIRALAISAAAIKEMYAEFTALKARVAELENA
jgi:cytoskeletal protein CcmA (bactofilin family)